MIARRASRAARAVAREALRSPRSVPAPVDFAEFNATLRAAVALAPALPPRAWSIAATMTWAPPTSAGASQGADLAHTIARRGNALAHLAAVCALHMVGASRLSRRARRCARATIARETRDLTGGAL